MIFYQNCICMPFFHHLYIGSPRLYRMIKTGTWLIPILFVQYLAFMPRVDAAIQMDRLYEAETEVAGQDAKERRRAFKRMFGEVITRISGTTQSAMFPTIIDAMKRPERFVQQYRYFQKKTKDVLGQKEVDASISMLWARFDRKAIITLLQKSELPVWQDTRPAILVWLALDFEGQRYLLGNDDISPMREYLDLQATRRGVPLLFPLMDLEDQQQISFTDIWGGFSGAIHEASRRYATEAVMVGRILQDRNGRWAARWKLYDIQGELQWETEGDQAQESLGAGVDALADRLGGLYAVYEGEQLHTQVTLNVSEVRSLQAYARVQKYLHSISVISKKQLIQLEEDRLRFKLDIQGKLSDLTQVFALKNILAPDLSASLDRPPRQDLAQQPEPQLNISREMAPLVTNAVTTFLPSELFYRLRP